MEIKSFENNLKNTFEKFFPCDTFMQKSAKGEEELIVDFTVQIPDRYKEILLVDGCRLEEYYKNPIIQADHDFSIRSTVGSCKWIKKMGDRIRIAPLFGSTEFARDVEILVKEKHLKTVSHTFNAYSYVDDIESIETILEQYKIEANAENINRIYLDWEPLEISWVAVPANTEAMVRVIEDGTVKSKAFIDSLKAVSSLADYLEKKEKVGGSAGKSDLENKEELKKDDMEFIIQELENIKKNIDKLIIQIMYSDKKTDGGTVQASKPESGEQDVDNAKKFLEEIKQGIEKKWR